MSLMELSQCPAWWTTYIQPDDLDYDPAEPMAVLCHNINARAPEWVKALGIGAPFEANHFCVPVDMTLFMAAFPHGDELHELLRETPWQVLTCLSACVHQASRITVAYGF